MAGFAEFYQDGGVFMHAVSVCGVIGTGVLVKAIRRPAEREQRLDLLTTVVHGCVLFGLMGTVLGFTEMFGALASLKHTPVHEWHLAMSRGGQIALTPLTWALMLATPLIMAKSLLQRKPDARATAQS